MAVALLVIFLALVLVMPRVAFIALALAIVLLYRGGGSKAARVTSRHLGDDTSI